MKVTLICTPAPAQMLLDQLNEIFPNDFKKVYPYNGYESVLMIDLTDKQIEVIEEFVGDVIFFNNNNVQFFKRM